MTETKYMKFTGQVSDDKVYIIMKSDLELPFITSTLFYQVYVTEQGKGYYDAKREVYYIPHATSESLNFLFSCIYRHGKSFLVVVKSLPWNSQIKHFLEYWGFNQLFDLGLFIHETDNYHREYKYGDIKLVLEEVSDIKYKKMDINSTGSRQYLQISCDFNVKIIILDDDKELDKIETNTLMESLHDHHNFIHGGYHIVDVICDSRLSIFPSSGKIKTTMTVKYGPLGILADTADTICLDFSEVYSKIESELRKLYLVDTRTKTVSKRPVLSDV